MGSGSRNYRALRMRGKGVKKKKNLIIDEEKKKVSEEDKKALVELWLKRKQEIEKNK